MGQSPMRRIRERKGSDEADVAKNARLGGSLALPVEPIFAGKLRLGGRLGLRLLLRMRLAEGVQWA